MGFKFQIETNMPLSSTADNLWFLGLFLSGVEIALMIILGAGFFGVLLASIFGVAWLWVLLVFGPRPIFSMSLLLVIDISAVSLLLAGP